MIRKDSAMLYYANTLRVHGTTHYRGARLAPNAHALFGARPRRIRRKHLLHVLRCRRP